MTCEQVWAYFEQQGLRDRITEREEVSDTAEHSAVAIGCKIGQIAKTLSFLQNGKLVVILMSGEAKVDNRKYRACFGVKSTMVPFNKVEELTGYAPGAVSPYLLPEGTEVYLDESLKRYHIVYTAAGSLTSTIELTLEELMKYSGAKGFVDVCKNWQPEVSLAS